MSYTLLLLTLAKIVGIVLLADFVAGFIHWLEDSYFSEDTPVIGPLLIRPNIVHHHLPRYFTRLSWWESSRELVVLAVLLLASCWALGVLSWETWLFVAVGINANQVHKWSHRTRAENGRLVSTLQDWGILQTPHHHGLHHKDPKNTYYCPLTNWLNPALEAVRFWPRLEAGIKTLTGLEHRTDTAVRGQGPGPQWLNDFHPTRLCRIQTGPCRACKNCRDQAK